MTRQAPPALCRCPARHGMADAAGKEGRRVLKIKCGAVSRLRKEITLYEVEATQQQAKVDRMRADNACPHDIKQQARRWRR